MSDQIRIIYQDFRSAEGTYDKVASVGMLEHVPRWEYKRYFAKIRSLLAPQGMGLVHAIGCNGPRNEHDPFIQKYIFPFSSQPKLSEITALLEGNRLAILDVENIVRHYAHTARAWLARFRDKTNGLDPLKYDARFRRMWEYYLACGIAAALASDSAVYQILFMRDHTAEIPLHRI